MSSSSGRIVLVACLALGAGAMIAASLNYMLDPMFADLDLSGEQAQIPLTIPGIASLLVVFVAAALSKRYGARRTLVTASAISIVGSIGVATTQSLGMLTLGLLLTNASVVVLAVSGVALLGERVTETKQRAAAFASLGMVYPAVFIVVPVVVGLLIRQASWRLTPVLWILVSAALIVVVRALLPRGEAKPEKLELFTPILAGLILAGLVQVISHWDSGGITSPRVLIPLTGALIAAGVLAITLRRIPMPTFSAAPLRERKSVFLLVALICVNFSNTFFYITVGWQYLYDFTVLQTAIIMIPTQLAALLGAKLIAGPAVEKYGLYRSGIVLMLAYAASLFALVLLRADDPIWFAVILTGVFGAMSAASSVIITNAVMSSQPPSKSGAMSSFQKASSALAGSLSAIIMTGLVFGAVGDNLEQKLIDSGVPTSTAASLSNDLQAAGSHTEQMQMYSTTVPGSQSFEDLHEESVIAGLRTNAVFGGVIVLFGTVLFVLARPQRRAEDPETPDKQASSTTS